jgi:hypothetical protein
MPTQRRWRRRHPARADQELSEQPAARPRDDPKRRRVAGPWQDRVGRILTELLAALGDDLAGLDQGVRRHTRASWHRDQRAQPWVDQLVEAQAERDRLYAW